MNQFFSLHSETFQLFSLSHLTVLFIIFVMTLLLALFGKKIKQQGMTKIIFRYLIVLMVFFLLLAKFIWQVRHGIFHIADSLPLELCDITFVLSGVLCLTPQKKTF